MTYTQLANSMLKQAPALSWFKCWFNTKLSWKVVFMASNLFDLIVLGAGPGGYVAAIRAFS